MSTFELYVKPAYRRIQIKKLFTDQYMYKSDNFGN